MSNAFEGIELYLAKIEARRALDKPARDALLNLDVRIAEYQTYSDIVKEGDRTEDCCIVTKGFVSRYKTLKNGGRQINSFHLPGDFIDLQTALVTVADNGVRTHVPTTVVKISAKDILDLAARFPQLAQAFWFDTLVEAAGLTSVHTNRSLQAMRANGWIRAYGKTIEIEDPAALESIAGFDTGYLHPEGPRC